MRGIPPITGDLRQWAQGLTRALQGGYKLPFKTAESSAAEDGILMFDPSGTVPNMTRSGAFVQLGVRVTVPATATSTGNLGEWAADATHFYVCTAANTWRRTTIAAW